MSSVVIYRQGGVVAEWNKGAAYSVTDDTGKVTRHASESLAIQAAKRRAKRLSTESPMFHLEYRDLNEGGNWRRWSAEPMTREAADSMLRAAQIRSALDGNALAFRVAGV